MKVVSDLSVFVQFGTLIDRLPYYSERDRSWIRPLRNALSQAQTIPSNELPKLAKVAVNGESRLSIGSRCGICRRYWPFLNPVIQHDRTDRCGI